ncbi:MAG: hypothetical protein ACD_63C00180G0010 [uncultured bacterium]|nr:MAG: hypothetical protein ACD_63C00180G0010 [uncultured bacterium]
MKNSDNNGIKYPWKNQLLHVAISAIITYFILLAIETAIPYSVSIFLDMKVFLWIAGAFAVAYIALQPMKLKA